MEKPKFWISDDGIIVSKEPSDKEGRLKLICQWTLKKEADLAFVRNHIKDIQFTERSTLARIGIEILELEKLTLRRNKVTMVAEAFVVDDAFPTWQALPQILLPGIPLGRLFYAPPEDRLSSREITEAIRCNELKLPNTISIDQHGQVHLSPHRVQYSLPRKMNLQDLQRLAKGHMPRSFLNKVQIMHEVDAVTIPPKSGILTSCTMYLRKHYVLLKRGAGNFGVHSGAVLLDPAKTFGPNIMLEIYNLTDFLVVNPLVAVEVYRAPEQEDPEVKTLSARRTRRATEIRETFEAMDKCPVPTTSRARPKTSITLHDQSALTTNPSLTLPLDEDLTDALRERIADASCNRRTVLDALSHMRSEDDTIVTTYFPNLFEHIEIMTRFQKQRPRHLVFRNASREQPFFMTAEDHARLDTYEQLGMRVHWFCEPMDDLYRYIYKKGHGFFLREELRNRFDVSTIFAMYGSAVDLQEGQSNSIRLLINRLVEFFGPTIGFLTGGGGGVMGTATDAAREKGCLVGSCFLELEAQPPQFGVDFFNSFRETSRHNRQKWFEVADFCIFNIGGVGTLEEIGIEMCNLKLGIRPRMPYVFYSEDYWDHLGQQLRGIIRDGRAPRWIQDYVLFTNDPNEVINFYRKTLQVV